MTLRDKLIVESEAIAEQFMDGTVLSPKQTANNLAELFRRSGIPAVRGNFEGDEDGTFHFSVDIVLPKGEG